MKLAPLLALLVLASCGGEDEVLEVTLSLDFQVRGNDTDGDGTLVDDKRIDEAPDDPWARFAAEAMERYPEGPGELVLDEISMQLLPSSSGVEDLGDVFNGPIGYRFRVSGTQNEYSLGIVDIRDESTATAIDSFLFEFDYERTEERDREGLVAGAGRMLFVGQASDEFRNTNKVADMSATFRFHLTPPEEMAPAQNQ